MCRIYRKILETVVVLALASLSAGCIAYVVPVDSWEESSLQGYDFRQYVGARNDEIIRLIGMPDFILSSDERDDTYFIYERRRFVDSEWGHYEFNRHSIGPEITGNSGRFTNEDGKSCYLFVFDADETMVGYEADWIRHCPDGRGSHERANVSRNPSQTTPDLDCRKFYWDEEELARIENIDTQTFLDRLVEKSDSDSAFALYKTFSEARATFKVGWIALCKAANGKLIGAQLEVGLWHRSSMWKAIGPESKALWLQSEVGILPDDRVAYMWYTLAGSNGDSFAISQREYLAESMSSEEIAQADEMVRNWSSGDCPSSENRLPPPEET